MSALMDIPTITSRMAINRLLDYAYNQFHLDIDHLDHAFATRSWFWYNMKTKDYDLVIYYGHGKEDKLKGNNIWQSAITKKNIYKLNGTPMSTMACFSAKELGMFAVENNYAPAYIGTITPYYAAWDEKERDFLKDWIDYTTSKDIALMDGKSFGEAFNIFQIRGKNYLRIYEQNKGYKNFDWYYNATKSNLENTILIGNPDIKI